MGIRCLLISTNQVTVPYPVYPLGIAHLVGALEDAGHTATHVDLMAHGGLAALGEHVANGSPDLVGLSLRNLDMVDSTVPDTFLADFAAVVEVVRGRSTAPVVLGGPAFSLMPEEIRERLGAEYGIAGEGESLLPWLADRVAEGAAPPPCVLTGPPAPDPWRPVVYDRTAAAYYLRRGGMLNIQTKRGCPFRCDYCSYPHLEGHRLRVREPEAVAAEVARVSRELGARYIFFTDAVFNDPAGHYLEVAEALVRAGNRTPWCAFFRPSHLTSEAIALMKRAGLAAMELGSDAATDDTLAGLHKGFDFAEVIATNEAARKAAVPCAHFLIFGGPGEDDGTLREGLKNVECLAETVVFAFAGIRILPHTAIHRRAIADGVIGRDRSLLTPAYYFSPAIEPTRLDATLRAAWANRVDRIYPCSEVQGRIDFLHGQGYVGPLWDLMHTHRVRK
jgi:radical SAM superfamily enzyme YgiQ (UPF0313 family)